MKTQGSEKKALKQFCQDNVPIQVGFFDLLRFSTFQEKLLMILGGLAAFINGASFPCFSIIIGRSVDQFSSSGDSMVEQAGWNALYYMIIGVSTFILSFLMYSTWMMTADSQSIKYRQQYFGAILKQEIGWFDTINPNELSTKVASETFSIYGAIGEKVPTFIMTFSTGFFGFLIGYIFGWQLALVITSALPAITIATAIFAKTIQTSEKATQQAYSSSGALVEQALSQIKTVKMLDGEDFEVHKYITTLKNATDTTIRYSFGVGLSFGFLSASMLWTYALGFWYGAKLISDQTFNDNFGDVYTIGDIMVIFYAILTGGQSLGQCGPCLQDFAKGKEAASKIFSIIDRIPKIVSPPNGLKLNHFNGQIYLKDIQFCYPNQPTQQILNGLTLMFPAGKKIALVGESGCGKSTIMQLIQRFYDCDNGEVLFGGEQGINVKDLDLVDLRKRIGLVGQEPVLFATTIKENLLYGRPDATENEMIDALKKANAWDFISKMEKGLNTYVGIGGGQLSGGQKQRIAIARAILKKPQILLLDEATSALDRTNEKLIQTTLDEISKGITTIVIAHRLSTIQNADLIYVIDKGIVIEQGNHQELIKMMGKYYQLAQHQLHEKKDNQINQVIKQEENEYQINNLSESQRILQQDLIQLNPEKIGIAIKDQFEQVKELNLQELIQSSELKNNNNQNYDQQMKQKEVKMSRLFSYNRKEILFFILGSIASLANGCTFPIFSIFFADITVILIQSNPKYAQDQCYENYIDPTQEFCEQYKADLQYHVRNRTNEIALWFFIIGIAIQVLWTLQMYFLSYYGEKLTFKLRIDTYRKLLRMPIKYFDIPINNAGTLSSRLAVDCKIISSLISSILGSNISNAGSFICGIVIAFIYCWPITLIMLAFTPLSFIGRIFQQKSLQGYSDLTDTAFKDSGNLIMEAVTNMRTVMSFGNEQILLGIYTKKVQIPLLKGKEKAMKAGLAFGYSQSLLYVINTIIFYVGAVLVKDDYINVDGMFKSFFALSFAIMGAASSAAFAGDVVAAKKASQSVFEILDSEDEFQTEIRLNKKKLQYQISGDIVFNNLTFKYPGRNKNVFENLTLNVGAGQKVAFVGPSGCGKSTLMQMLMRFYEPDQGTITINGIDITDYDIRHIRRQIGIVSQEPVLFNGSIKDNIQYNLQTTMEQIEESAKQANAFEFIMKNQFDDDSDENSSKKQLGQGFNRQVGSKGTQISGGQKQRIAIARAILRNSNLLLLDEATSALDSASEKLVQDSLNKLMTGKTTIAIAHRISTIKDSDVIYVFEDGKIVESGNYTELTKEKGAFYRLEQGIVN